ncbi:unnamed protein product [marine sediment metagenome]|uniref:LPXTG cell wall anchor domain-containing protein n=1 Tax=marine sediment metagenome TaxID=412755 RepID=X1FYU5_9ZZZZ
MKTGLFTQENIMIAGMIAAAGFGVWFFTRKKRARYPTGLEPSNGGEFDPRKVMILRSELV